MPRPIVSRLEMQTLNSQREPKNTNVTSVRRSRANQTSRHVRTRHVRHIFTSDDQTNQNLFISRKQFVKYYHFNPIHVATKRDLVGLLQQSIPFHVDLVYILVHYSKFSLINFVVVSAEKSSSLHTIYFLKNTNKPSISSS